MAGADPYVLLGIDPDASPEEIRAGFRRAVRQRHPDTSLTAGDDSAVRSVIDAYRLLIDPGARARYDAEHPPPQVTGRGARRARVRKTSAAGAANPAGMTRCPRCRGAGIVRSIVSCPACRGRAEITTLDVMRARVLHCRTCRGSGRIRASRVCEGCDGTGTAAPHG